MLYLVLSILSSTGIFLVFKIAGLKNVHILSVVSINYIIATLLGISVFVLGDGKAGIGSLEPAFHFSTIVLGVVFMLMFLVVQLTSIKSGMVITSAAAKLSVVIPVIVSLIIDPLDIFNAKKVVGLTVMIGSIILIVYSPGIWIKKGVLLLPLFLLLGMGVVDSMVKASQQYIIGEERIPVFALLAFFWAGVSGLSLMTIRGEIRFLFKRTHFIYGALLGVFNYCSLTFLIKTLNLNLNVNSFLDSSRIFMLNNIGIIILSILVGLLVFKERLHAWNYIGLTVSMVGFYLLV